MLNQIFTITTFLIPIFAFGLGFYTIYKNRSKLAILWFLTSMAVGVWGIGLAMLLIVETRSQAFLCNFILYTGAILIPVLFYHFVSALLFKDQQNKSIISIGYILSVIFLILLYIPPMIIRDVTSQAGFKYWEEPGILYIPFLIYFWFYAFLAIIILIKGLKTAEGIHKTQVYYILLAAIIGYFGGGTNYLPQTVGIYPFGNFITFLYPILITYGFFLKRY